MAGANTNKLTQVLGELKSELGFKPGEGGNLSPSDPYPLSTNPDGSPGVPLDERLQVLREAPTDE